MKKNLLAGLLLFSGVLFAQHIEPKYEIVGKMVKATYYYDNGQVKQEGFYLNGKLQGKWVAFNEDGSKQSIGEYTGGMKTGKWFFWNNATLAEVDYSKSKISEIKKWSKDGLANRN
ncbi:membrane-binding protein [Flavobacterium enshiense]|uniref:toxin-antitoxin system YwqK family antitoxin n=1 Tax=Flavobacterium enshiense TaxID=1341165 RepID=UPI00345CCE79